MSSRVRVRGVEKEIGTTRYPVCFRVVSNMELGRPPKGGSLRCVTARAIHGAFTSINFIFFVYSETNGKAYREGVMEDVVPIFGDYFRFQRTTFFPFNRRLCRYRFVFRVVRSGCMFMWCVWWIQYVVLFVITLFGKGVFRMFRNVRDHMSVGSTCVLVFSNRLRLVSRSIRYLFCNRYFHRQFFHTTVIQVINYSCAAIRASVYR